MRAATARKHESRIDRGLVCACCDSTRTALDLIPMTGFRVCSNRAACRRRQLKTRKEACSCFAVPR